MCLENWVILSQTVYEIYSGEAVVCDIFDRILNFDNCQLEVVSDVISGMVVDPTGVKVPVKFGDSRSNRSRDIRLPHFVTNDSDSGRWTYDNRAKRRIAAFCLKIKNLENLWGLSALGDRPRGSQKFTD